MAQASFQLDIHQKLTLNFFLILVPPSPVCSDGRHSAPCLVYTELHLLYVIPLPTKLCSQTPWCILKWELLIKSFVLLAESFLN